MDRQLHQLAQNAVIKLTGTISGNLLVTVPLDSVEKVIHCRLTVHQVLTQYNLKHVSGSGTRYYFWCIR